MTVVTPWVPVVAALGVERKRVRLRSGGERVYEGYRAWIPREVVEKLGLRGGSTVLLQVARPRWYHLLDYQEEPLRSRSTGIHSQRGGAPGAGPGARGARGPGGAEAESPRRPSRGEVKRLVGT